MERKEWIDGCRRLFTRLVRTTVWADFVFPTGGKSDRQLGMCFDGLCREVVSVSAERLSDFCICQTYAISGYDTAYRRKWNVSHSFGKKAIGRYLRSGKERRYREDRWLKSFGLSRHDLARAVEALSTLMWTPFSPSCSKCAKAEPCRRRTQARYPELYRIRCEAWRKKEAKP